jgi:transposase
MIPMRVAQALTLTEEQRTALVRWSRGRSTPARLVLRAKIVLRAADAMLNKDIAVELQTDVNTVGRWRKRFAAGGLDAIAKDAPRGGRKPTKRARLAARIIKKTTTEKPAGATHWSTRTLAKALKIDKSMVQRVWAAGGLKPHLVRTFKVSNDPRFAEKLVDVVGLYLNPPDNALVLCADEKSQIQALDRTQPSLPMFKGRCATLTHDYKRNGTTTLFAAIELAQGRLIGTCMSRHRHQEWIKFLKLIDAQTPADLVLHIIADNYATHKHPRVKAWLARHKRFHIHFTPTSSSWLNLIERWFRDLTDKCIRRGVFSDVPELIEAITTHIAAHNKDPKSIVWTAKAEDILKKVRRARATLDNLQSA